MKTLKIQVPCGDSHCGDCLRGGFVPYAGRVCTEFKKRDGSCKPTKFDKKAGDFKRVKQCLAAEMKEENQ